MNTTPFIFGNEYLRSGMPRPRLALRNPIVNSSVTDTVRALRIFSAFLCIFCCKLITGWNYLTNFLGKQMPFPLKTLKIKVVKCFWIFYLLFVAENHFLFWSNGVLKIFTNAVNFLLRFWNGIMTRQLSRAYAAQYISALFTGELNRSFILVWNAQSYSVSVFLVRNASRLPT